MDLPFESVSWPAFAIAVALALVAAIVVAAVVAAVVRAIGKRRGWDPAMIGRVRRPFRVLLVVIGLWIATKATFPERGWIARLDHLAAILVIAAGAWLLAGVVSFAFSAVMARFPIDVEDNRVARRVQTQLGILRRIAQVVIVIVGLGAVLLTFPGVQAVGASLIASAGLASVIAGLAAQSTLANVFAGLQLAFSDAIRVDDVVVANSTWGRIEEITLTYVVVHVWDDRRLVLPSTYFTTTPFENWTRRESALLGSVEFDLDWRVSPSEMRAQLDVVLAGEHLWDGRVGVLQITDAIGGMVRVRVLVSAASAPQLFDLRCNVREALVEWVLEKDPGALPRQRVEVAQAGPEPRRRARKSTGTDRHEGVFTGSIDAEKRAQSFTQAVPVQTPIEGAVDAPRGATP